MRDGPGRSPVYVAPIDTCGDDDTPPTIAKVAENLPEFANSLTQPQEFLSDVEKLAQESWPAVQEYLTAGGDLDAKSPSGLSLLCQSIRYANDEVFEGLLARGADLTDALRIAVTNHRLDLVKRLVASGSDPADGLPFAVGPKRKEIREFLKECSGPAEGAEEED